MAKVDDIFKRFAERNRKTSVEIERTTTRKPPKPIDYEAMDAAERARIDRELDPDREG
jgi:hypothetical protein